MSSDFSMNRRDWLQAVGLAAAGGLLGSIETFSTPLIAADDPAVAPLNRFPRMVQEYFVQRVRQAEQIGATARAQLKTKADAEAYVKGVKEKIRTAFGPFPEKTPLNPRVVGQVDRDVYRIEKVIFESRPEFLVSANLYIPKGKKFPLPGVVCSCGHSANGKAIDAYQSVAQGLARMGYVTLIFDPIGQGERLQYLDETRTKSTRGVGVTEHLAAGNQQVLVGEFFGAWRAWDGIRALDYLLTREEVDPKHVGITGNSGGGTMTTWLCGLEDRWTMAAPGCFVTTFRRNMENELPADSEQCPPCALALGLDHADFLAVMAPKPVIILAKERDYFDARGAEEAYARLQKIYELLGAKEKIALFIGPTEHGYTQENREAMYQWFNRATGVSDAQTEPAITIEKDETLACVPGGQVAQLNSRPIFDFTRAKSKQLAAQRTAPGQPALGGKALSEAITSALKVPAREGVPEYRILRALSKRGYPQPHFSNYAVESEQGIHVVVYRLSPNAHYSRPPTGRERAVLYVSHHSADAELRMEPLVREVFDAEKSADYFACDVRGIGESQPNTCGDPALTSAYGSDFFYSSHALMLDEPYVGRKTHDLLRVCDWLSSFGYKEVHLVGLGWGALPATFAAVLSDLVTQVTLKNGLTSYADVAESEHYDWPLSAFVPHVLEHFDLPDCYRELQRKHLRQVEPIGPKRT